MITTYGRASDASACPAPAGATGDQILEGMRRIFAAADAITQRLQARIPGMDGHAAVPFALRDLLAAGRRGLPQVEMARLLRMSPSSATRLIDSLEAHGLVRRDPHPNDRRINQVVLTVVGKALIEDLLSDVERRKAELELDDLAALDGFTARLARMASVLG